MEPRDITWLTMIVGGAVLGAFLRPAVVGKLVLVLLSVCVAGSFAAAYFELIRAEWLLLLMGAPFAGAAIFVSAVLSNALVGTGSKARSGAETKRERKG